MDLEARILFKDVVADTDSEDVLFRLQCCANEWFFPEVTKTMPDVQVSIAPPCEDEVTDGVYLTPDFVTYQDGEIPVLIEEPASLLKKPARNNKPVFVVSDLHLGDKGPRDNFAAMSDEERPREFTSFLDFVEDHDGQLIIAGDLFELWQSNISVVLTTRPRLLDRLAKMGAIYILGNHDIDLMEFRTGCPIQFTHPFFKTMRLWHTECIGGKTFRFCHGHEVDRACASIRPGLGRISAIYTGLREDRNNSPLLSKYRTVEARSLGRLERLANFFRWWAGKPDRTKVMNLGLCAYLDSYDVVVSGHTHRAGQLSYKDSDKLLPVYNTGTWAELECSFVWIDPTGRTDVYNWIDGNPCLNPTVIEV